MFFYILIYFLPFLLPQPCHGDLSSEMQCCWTETELSVCILPIWGSWTVIHHFAFYYLDVRGYTFHLLCQKSLCCCRQSSAPSNVTWGGKTSLVSPPSPLHPNSDGLLESHLRHAELPQILFHSWVSDQFVLSRIFCFR